ncbi:uncharacterized protein isoform X2 [Rhodnius prolixus]
MHLGSVLTSGTAMTLDARFTQLRRGESLYEDGAGGCAAVVSRSGRQQAVASASVRNRRLAIQMSRRPAVVAALNRGVPRNMSNGIMNRLGRGAAQSNAEVGTFRSNAAFAANNFRRRSNSASRVRAANIAGGSRGGFRRGGGSTRRGGARGAGNNRTSRPLVRSNSVSRMQRSGSLGRISRSGSLGNLSRSGSLSRLTRSQSLQSLSGWANNAFRGRGMGRGRRRGGRGRRGGIIHGFISRLRDSFGRMSRGSGGNQSRANRGGGVGRNNFRGRNQRGGAARSFRGSRNNNLKFRGGGGGRGSGGIAFRGGRGRGRGGRGRQKEQVPTKEALDMEIDEYMSTTKSHLDKEIESYMNQPAEDGVVNTNQTNCTATESWD